MRFPGSDGPDPRGMALSSDRSRLYVAHFLTRFPNNDAHVTEIRRQLKETAATLG